MAIITVSREQAALGDETARELARLTGFRLVDKEALEERMRSYGIDADRFRKYDERKPSFFSAPSERDDYLHFLKRALLAEVEEGSCVIVGRGASRILAAMPALISVFLSARREIRVERVKSYFHCDERRAEQIIDRSDRDRSGFYRTFFDAEWRHPGNYHLALNTGVFAPAVCAGMVDSLKALVFTPEAEAGNAEILGNMLMEHRITHGIVYEQMLPIRFFEVSVFDGVVTLSGATNSRAILDSAMKCAREASGGASVRNDIQTFR